MGFFTSAKWQVCHNAEQRTTLRRSSTTHRRQSPASHSSLATRLRLVCLCVFDTDVFPRYRLLPLDAIGCSYQRYSLCSKICKPVLLSIIRSRMWARGAIILCLERGAPSDAASMNGWPEGVAWKKRDLRTHCCRFLETSVRDASCYVPEEYSGRTVLSTTF